MIDVVNTLWLFIGGIIVTVVLGMIAGFSPTLYMTQIGIGLKAQNKKAFAYMLSIMIGVVGALIVLTILFQFFHLNTLITFIDTTIKALLVSVIFNILVGTALIVGGFWYINHRDPEAKAPKPMKKSGQAALISFGFLRTFVSITGVTATFIASNLIAETSPGIVLRVVMTLIFLAAALVPFAGIGIVLRSNPAYLEQMVANIKTWLKKLNYRPVIGTVSIIFGSALIIFNLLMAIFY